MTRTRTEELAAAAKALPTLPSGRSAMKDSAKLNMPEKTDLTRTIGGSWGKVRVSGGKNKGYIQYWEQESKKWRSILNFCESNFRELAQHMFEYLCDNPECTKNDLIEQKKTLAENMNANAAIDNKNDADGEDTPYSMKVRFCDFWED